MPEKPSRIAKAGLTIALFSAALSLANAAFSVYQWRVSRDEARIAAAIEISKIYLRDRDQTATKLALGIYLNSSSGGLPDVSLNDLELIGRHAEFLEFVAILAENEKLNRSYLSPALICDITWTAKAVDLMKDRYASRP